MSRGIPKVKQWRARFTDDNGRTLDWLYVDAPTKLLAKLQFHDVLSLSDQETKEAYKACSHIVWSSRHVRT